MNITTSELKQWADTVDCQNRLPVLIRSLIQECNDTIKFIEFPGFKSINLPGFDGIVEAERGNQWVPKGNSYWEVSCQANPNSKADRDYESRMTEPKDINRKRSEYIAVTPRQMTKKNDWEKTKNEDAIWKKVRAHDCKVLENWLGQCPLALHWLNVELGNSYFGITTPDRWWNRWSTSTNPILTPKIIATRENIDSVELLKKLEKQTEPEVISEKLIYHSKINVIDIYGDNRDEAIAFVIATFMINSEIDLLRRTIIITNPDADLLVFEKANPIFICAYDGNKEPDFGAKTNKTIIRTSHKGVSKSRDALVLSKVSKKTIGNNLRELGVPESNISKCTADTEIFLPNLRRLLGGDFHSLNPDWSDKDEILVPLVPFAFCGSWENDRKFSDLNGLQELGNFTNDELNTIMEELAKKEDSPFVFKHEGYKLKSHLDALILVANRANQIFLSSFFQFATNVLQNDKIQVKYKYSGRTETYAVNENLNGSENLKSGILATINFINQDYNINLREKLQITV